MMMKKIPPKKLEMGSVYVGPDTYVDAGSDIIAEVSVSPDVSSIYFVSIRGTICMDSSSCVKSAIA